MIARNELEIYLAKVTQQFSATEAHAILMRSMRRCLPLTPEFLPEGLELGYGILAARTRASGEFANCPH
jgi:hypothetical protein